MLLEVLMIVACSLIAIQVFDCSARFFLGWVLVTPNQIKVPPENRVSLDRETLLVVPVILTGSHSVAAAIQCLERNIAASHDLDLPVAVLSDLFDSKTRDDPSDVQVLRALLAELAALSERCRNDVYLLHRDRTWNARERVWMGWERKRGKLLDLNRLLLGEELSSVKVLFGSREKLKPIKMVITLDVDATLQQGGCAELAARLKTAIGAKSNVRVSVLQPMPQACPLYGRDTHFSRIWRGPVRAEDETIFTAGFDVYQHFFCEGSYYGKGIYHVASFHQAVRFASPPDMMLSHDILEGALAGSQMCCDVRVFEPGPSSIGSELKRRHRWIRGDWQLSPYLFLPFPRRSRPFARPKISLLSRWKLLDNLRRSITPIAFVYAYAFLALVDASVVSFAYLLAANALPEILSLLKLTADSVAGRSFSSYGRDAILIAKKAIIEIAFTPMDALISIDAIVKAIWRLYVSGKRLLEWQTFSDLGTSYSKGNLGNCKIALPSITFAAIICFVAVQAGSHLNQGVMAVVLLWAASPFLIWRLEQRQEE